MTSDLRPWAALVRRHAHEAGITLPLDIVEELALHLFETYSRALDEGDSESAARARAEQTLATARMSDLARSADRRADTRLVAESSHERATPLFGLWCDLRYAVRLIRRSAAFSLAVMSVLALSIGAAAAVWTIVHAVLLRPLPYPDPHQLMVLQKLDVAGRVGQLSAADWRDYASRVGHFDGLAAHASWTHNLVGDGEPIRLRSTITTGNFFRVLRARAASGRVYGDADDQPGAGAVVVLSSGLWARRFGNNPRVIGRTLTLNGHPATVIGVMPRDFAFPSHDVDVWLPIAMGPELGADRGSEWLGTVGRLRPGVTSHAAAAEASATAAALAREFPRTNAGERVALVPLKDSVVGDVQPALLAIAAAVAFVFLVTCLNIVNLLLSRATARREEMAVRFAVGASTWRVARQALTENALWVAVASVPGVVIAHGLVRGALVLASDRVPRLQPADLAGADTIVAAAVAGVIALVVCAATSALSLINARRVIAPGARVTPAQGVRRALLTTQIAVSFVLVASGLLLAGSYQRLQDAAPGFDSQDVLSLRLTLPRTKYPDSASHARFVGAVTRELRHVSSVESVGVVNDLPFSGNQMSFAVSREGRLDGDQHAPRATIRLADAGYFTTLRVPLVAGRLIEEADTHDRELIVVANQAAASRYFSGDAIGRRMRVGESRDWRRIVGIVGDTRHAGLQADEGPVLYVPYAQKPFDFVNWVGLLVRAPHVATVAAEVKWAVAAVDPTQPVYDVLLLDDYVARAQAPYRLNAWIVCGLAGLSLMLAVAGVFSLAHYNVSTSRQELGLRVALGASWSSMVWLVLRGVLLLLLAGTLVGAFGAALATRLFTSLLFQMAPTDLRLYAIVALLLLASGLAAALPPALRAAHADPLTTLRSE